MFTLRDKDTHITKQEIVNFVKSCELWLKENNLNKKSVVAIKLPNGIEYVKHIIALSTLCKVMPLANDANLSNFEKFDCLLDKPITDRQITNSTINNSRTFVMHTSGTTGHKRSINWTSSMVDYAVKKSSEGLKLCDKDVAFLGIPNYHGHAIITIILSTWLTNGTIYCWDNTKPFTFWKEVEESKTTWISASPSFYRNVLRLYKGQSQLPDLRFWRTGSEQLDRGTWERLRAFNKPVLEAYAGTEGTSFYCTPVYGEDGYTFNAIATPDPAILRIVDNEIQVMGPHVYVDDWYSPGDLGYIDESGKLYFTGRNSIVINSGGFKISPNEREAEIYNQYPQIKECVVFAGPHNILGEVPYVLYTCEENLPIKYGKRVDKLIKTDTGKIYRNRDSLRKIWDAS